MGSVSIWLRRRVHISVNVLRRVAAKLAVHSAIDVIIWPFSILSRIPIVGVGYCIKSVCGCACVCMRACVTVQYYYIVTLCCSDFVFPDTDGILTRCNTTVAPSCSTLVPLLVS